MRELHHQIDSISGFSVQSLMQKLTTIMAIQFHSKSQPALEMNGDEYLGPEVLMLKAQVCLLALTFTLVMTWVATSLFLQE